MRPADPHVVLGVAPGADLDAIAHAFRTQVKRHHPDLNPHDPGAAARFRAVVAAYEALCRAVAAVRDTVIRVQCLTSGANLFGTLSVPRGVAHERLLVQVEALCPCESCEGRGQERLATGWGRIEVWECETCRGSGVRRLERRLRVRIPDECEPGERIRLAGMGLPRPDGSVGDAILVVRR
jgi:DnaJ-class molecular chaperone